MQEADNVHLNGKQGIYIIFSAMSEMQEYLVNEDVVCYIKEIIQ